MRRQGHAASVEALLPAWDVSYPDRESLREDIRVLADAYVEAILEAFQPDDIRAVYLLGSGVRRWDTPIDYVPEASDVDLHVWFQDDERESSIDLALALSIQRRVEALYRARRPDGRHWPRPQLIPLNHIMRRPGFYHSPLAPVEALYGEEHPVAEIHDAEALRRAQVEQARVNAEAAARLPMRVIDRPGRYLAEVLRDLGYRVSPSGPIVLCLDGMDFATAWSLNRSAVVESLVKRGRVAFAGAYSRYYLARWRMFLSGYRDHGAARGAVLAADEVIRRAHAIGERCLAARDGV